jgi:hypothetical protein
MTAAIPSTTHLFLLVVPAVFAAAALYHFFRNAHRER